MFLKFPKSCKVCFKVSVGQMPYRTDLAPGRTISSYVPGSNIMYWPQIQIVQTLVFEQSGHEYGKYDWHASSYYEATDKPNITIWILIIQCPLIIFFYFWRPWRCKKGKWIFMHERVLYESNMAITIMNLHTLVFSFPLFFSVKQEYYILKLS